MTNYMIDDAEDKTSLRANKESRKTLHGSYFSAFCQGHNFGWFQPSGQCPEILLLVLGLEEYHPVVKNQKIPHALGLWVQLSSLSSSKLIPSMGLVLWALLFQSTLSSQLSITPQSMMSFFITFEVWFNTSCRGRLWFCCTSSYHFKQHSSIIFCWNYCKFPFMCSFLVLSFLVIIDIPHSNAHLCNIYIHFSFLWSPTSRSI